MAKKTETYQKEFRNLECGLTDADVREKTAQVVAKIREHSELEDAKKSTASAYKSQIDDLKASIKHMSGVIERKREMRSIECRWMRDEGRKLMVLVRRDTDETIATRPMTDSELQTELFDAPKAEEAAPAEAAPAKPKRTRKSKANGVPTLDVAAAPPPDAPTAA